jgi:murein DD-endopeptidase MepM/ murein hydrolase activator NlpD
MTTEIDTFNSHIPRFTLRYMKTALVTGTLAIASVVWVTPAHGLQAKITPSNAKLGTTLSVIVDVENSNSATPPQVTQGDKTYPAFPIAPNQYRALIPTTPLDTPGNKVIRITSGGEQQNLSVWVGDRKFPTQRIVLRGNKAGLQATAHELQRVKAFRALQTPEKLWSGPFIQPNQGPITTIYGVRRYYNGKFAKDYFHRGVDYAGASGSTVVAPAPGRVALVGTVAQGFRVHGNTVGIDHGQGVVSIFMHLSRINVKEGDIVKTGQLIGGVGSTGASTGPHLHWGLYVNGQSVDPVQWRFDSIK